MRLRIHFNLWYLYFIRPPWDSGISPPELLDFIANHPAGRAIDLGCGTGTNVVTLAQHAWDVTGVDFAPLAIRLAKRKIRAADVHASVLVGDVTNLTGISGPFDLALDLGCFHGIEARASYLSELMRILAPCGYWLMYAFFKSEGQVSGPGLTASDLDLIASHGLRLVTRKDGVDKRERPSAWFLYQRPALTGH
jgi:ubiquinone/menaquinone biosynthesis C-methylase UbiE